MTTRIGILYPEPPCAVEEYDAFAREASFPVEISVEFTPSVDSHEVSDLLETGEFGRLVAGAKRLLSFRPDVVLWACTSGSFVYGAEGVSEQARAIAEATGVPATSTSLAFIAALRALAFRRVALLAPYPPALTAHFERLLTDHGVALRSVISMRSPGASSSAAFELPDFESALARLALDDADCVLLPDTAAFGFRVADPLSESAGRPVLAANPVGLWHACRLAGVEAVEPRFGALAASPAPNSAV